MGIIALIKQIRSRLEDITIIKFKHKNLTEAKTVVSMPV